MKTKKPWLAALLNFVLLGPGYIYNGKKLILGIGLTIGAILLTYIEQVGLKELSPDLFNLCFVAVFIMATACAIDGYKEAQNINSGTNA